MKKSFLLLSVLITGLLCSFDYSSVTLKGGDVPNGPEGKTFGYQGKSVFIMTMPVKPYTVIDKDKPDGDALTMTNQIINTLDKAISKEGRGKMEKFDAAIVYGQYKSMEFIKFNDAI